MTGRGLSDSPKSPEHPIIFFDGMCALCNRFVTMILRQDKQGVFRLAALQGETARRMLPSMPADPGRWSMVYLDEQGMHLESDASLLIYRRLGGWFWWLSLARIVPRFLRDGVYRLVARNRYRWFGKNDTCRLPTEEERHRFLP